MNNENKANPFEPYEMQIDVSQRKEVIAPLLVELRQTKHYSQRQVAELIGISPQTYNGWEKGRSEPPIEYLVRLSFLYKVTMDTMCGKNVFAVPTKENVTKMLNTYRAQLASLQDELDKGDYTDNPEKKQQLQTMIDGIRAVLAMATQSSEKNSD